MKIQIIITKIKAWLLNYRKKREYQVPKYAMVSHHELMRRMNVDHKFIVKLMCKETKKL